jgi:hypothetical protein
MPLVRIVSAGASFLLFLAVTLTGAAAQTAPDGAAGQPLPLLQFIHKGRASKPKFRPHPEFARRSAKKKPIERKIAKRTFIKRHRALAEARHAVRPARVTAQASASTSAQNVWPSAAIAAPIGTASLAPDQVAAPVATEAVVDTNPNQIVASGHSVPTAVPSGGNAGNIAPAQAATPNSLSAANVAANGSKPAAKTTAPQSAAATPVVRAMVVKAEPPSANAADPVGSASWIAHVLAALGGAIAAGAVAWFLIRPAPEGNYG